MPSKLERDIYEFTSAFAVGGFLDPEISVWDLDKKLKRFIEEDRQSFIDYLRGKIEARQNALKLNFDLEPHANERRVYRAAIEECTKILILLNETSGETGK
jgi:hypothetical protein